MKNDKKNLFVLGIIISIIITIVFSTITVMAIMNGKQRSRTIMIYMVGSNLESQAGLATTDLNSINNISNQYTRVLLIAGGSRKWKNDYINSEETSIYELTNSGFKKVKDQPKQNMGAQETFSNFLSFAYDYSKSDEYDLIFWNHGGAIDGSEYDELNSNDNLSLAEMETSLQGSPFSKKKLEVVIFRTCLNGTIEVDSTFSNYAKYLVASEEVTLGASNTSVLNFINELSPKDSAQDVGKKFINSYKRQINDLKSYTTLSSDDSIYSTYSLINLSNVDKLNKSVNEFFSDIDINSNFNTISKVRANLYQYAKEEPSYDMVDLYNLVNELKELSPNKANKVLNNLDKTIIYNYATDSDSRGISIYFPYNGEKLVKDKFFGIYDNIVGLSDYKEFIKKFTSIQASDYKTYNYSLNTINSKESRDKDAYADFELELTDEQVETFAKAKYLVYRDLKTGYFKPVYNGLGATLEGNTLKASIKDRQIQVVGNNNERYDLLATEVENTDKYIKYTTNVILKTITGDIKDWKDDRAIITLYYDKETEKTDIASVVYDSNDSNTNNIALNISDYDIVEFSISSGWKILDDNGNYTGPQIVNGKVVGDGIITGFEEKVNNFKFELSNFDSNETYYCVFIITDTHNNKSYSKLIKLK